MDVYWQKHNITSYTHTRAQTELLNLMWVDYFDIIWFDLIWMQ